MKSKLKQWRIKFYQWLYTWALSKWREELNQPEFKRVRGRLSTHALMRYAERFDGYDFDAAEKTVLTDEAIKKIGDMGGDGKFAINGILYIVKNGTIVTVAEAEGIKAHLTYAPVDGSRGRRWTFD